MLDFDLSKLALIGAVALVVLGPERMSRVARIAGELLERAKRYANKTKAEVAHELDINGLTTIRSDLRTFAQHAENVVRSEISAIPAVVDLAPYAVKSSKSVDMTARALPKVDATNMIRHRRDWLADALQIDVPDSADTLQFIPVSPDSVATTSGYLFYTSDKGSSAISPAKRRNWKSQRSTLPTWYKHANRRRVPIRSGSARLRSSEEFTEFCLIYLSILRPSSTS